MQRAIKHLQRYQKIWETQVSEDVKEMIQEVLKYKVK